MSQQPVTRPICYSEPIDKRLILVVLLLISIGGGAYYYMLHYKNAFQLVSEIGHALSNEDIQIIIKQMFDRTFVKYETPTGLVIWATQELGPQVKRMITLNPIIDEETIEIEMEDILLTTYTLSGEYPIYVYIEDLKET
jgi:hypothetical protein